MSLNVLIPMAGLGSRFTKYGFTENKYLLPIDIDLTKMIEKAIITINAPYESNFIFILREEGDLDTNLRNYLKNICDKNNYTCEILSVSNLTEGPASTSYVAKELINNDTPLIVSNSDQILDWSFNKFYDECQKYDGCVLTYTPDYELIIGEKDKHSFVRFYNGNPVEFVEKTVISKEALVGVHYYKKGRFFIDAYEYMIQNNMRAPNGEFYLSYTYQALLDIGGFKIGTSLLGKDEKFYPVGEPEDYFYYYNNYHSFLKGKLETINIANQNYKLDYRVKDQELLITDELIIIISGRIKDIHSIVNLTGKNKKLLFLEDTYFLRFDNIISDEFMIIDPFNYTRGWLIGNFEPSIKKTTEFEVGILSHKKNEKWGFHYHKESIETNILLEGKMLINGKLLNAGDLFIFNKNMIACPIFLEDCKLICIKTPSVPCDKYII